MKASLGFPPAGLSFAATVDMARKKASSFEHQRGAIHEVAARLFAEQGFHNASMMELAVACGISKPLLYHYFRDKEEILFEIVDTYIDRLLGVCKGVEAERLPPEAALRRLVTLFMEEYEHSQSRHRVLVQDVKFLPADVRELVEAKQRQVVDAFARQLSGIAPELDQASLTKPVTMILFGMINWTFTWLRSDGRLTYGDMAPMVVELFLNGVKALGRCPGGLPSRGRAGTQTEDDQLV